LVTMAQVELLAGASDLIGAWGPELLSGAVGGLLVFGLTTYRDWRKARKLTKRERIGFLRLVDIEVYLNMGKLKMIRDSPDVGEQYRAYRELHTGHWEESRTQLIQLLPTDYSGVLAKYYGLLHEIGVHADDEGKKPSRSVARRRDVKVKVAIRDAKRETLLSVLAREALEYGKDIRQRAAVYIGETPDYFDLYEENQDAPRTQNKPPAA
jgi:hypothetical protein